MVRALVRSIERIQPDIVHSLEFQGAGYVTLEAKRSFKGEFPKWVATNWGSDIYLFGRLAQHKERVRAVLENCDFYSCECERDVLLAREYGLRGEVLPVFPNAGGFDLTKCKSLFKLGNISDRRTILLKGYQSWAGRALTGLRALARCQDILKNQGYSVAVFSAGPDVKIAAELFALETGVPVEIIPPCPHEEMLRVYGRSRVYMGLSISDAISTSLLEAMVMGAFPIQSCTACADEWIADGQTGLIVPPEDVDIIEKAIRRALTDDSLVNRAASQNLETAHSRLGEAAIRAKVIDFYKYVHGSKLERHL
jgi:glycosyltransferase involved in cell wall biosynthesis